jgi:predicted PurR-regulated permease PerM
MSKYIFTFILLIAGFNTVVNVDTWAKEVPYTLEDRDRLIRVEARLYEIDKRFEQMDKRFEQIDKRFEQIDKRFDDMFTFLWILAGIFTTLTGSTIGFAIWDRRSMIRPFEFRIKELEQGKIDRLISSLRDIAQIDKNVADILRKHNLL